MRTVRVEAPTRIDLAGGTLDLPPLYLFHQSAITINMAIQIRAEVSISGSDRTIVISRDQGIHAAWDDLGSISWSEEPRLELILRLMRSFRLTRPIRLEVDSQAPAGSGLGGSSAIAIALTAALARWCRVGLSKEELVDHAKSIETQTIRVPTGYQDYWAAVYGGVHRYEMGLNGRVKVRRLCPDAFQRELERHMLLVYVGTPRFSGANNWELFRRHIDGEKATIQFFEGLSHNALAMEAALESRKIGRVAEALNRDWETRKAMLPTMTTPEIEALMTEAFREGALGARVCGAGGGGCVALLIDPRHRRRLNAVIRGMGMQVLSVRVSTRGVTIETAADEGPARRRTKLR